MRLLSGLIHAVTPGRLSAPVFPRDPGGDPPPSGSYLYSGSAMRKPDCINYVPCVSDVAAGQPFGRKYLYKWWEKACLGAKIENVDLYGGTSHSSTTALLKILSPEEIRRSGTLHHTNKAFERYLKMTDEMSRAIYSAASIALPQEGNFF